MFYNEFEIQQLTKLRMEETERKALNAWKLTGQNQESFYQKINRKWSSREKSRIVPLNGGSACQCG